MASIALPAAAVQPLRRPAAKRSAQQKFNENSLKTLMPELITQSFSSSPSSSSLCSESTKASSHLPILKVKTQEESLLAVNLSSNYSARPRRKMVRYSTLEIRTYPLCLGDHPSVHGGLPLALDYSQPCQTYVVGMEDYERQRRPRSRQIEDLRLSRTSRRQKLLGKNADCAACPTNQQLLQCLQSIRLIQHQRDWTRRTRFLEPIQERLESIQKAVGNATWHRRRKQKERQLLQRYQSKSIGGAMAA